MLLVPTYNERANVPVLVDRVRRAAGNLAILFVDDNSPDGTADEVRRIQATDPAVRLVVRSGRRGYAPACLEGMRLVLENRLSPILIQCDCDLSHPPELLPKIIELLRTHPVVIGSRYVRGGGTHNWDLRRRALSRGGNLYARLLTGIPVHDATAGFIGYQTDVLRSMDLGALRSEGYAFLMEMKYALHRCGVPLYEMPIVFSERGAGASKFSGSIMREGILFPLRILKRRLDGRA